MKRKTLTEDELRDLLRKACNKAGSQSTWADTAGVSSVYVSDVLNQKRAPGDSILRALGYSRVVTYVPDVWDMKEQDSWKDDK